MDGAGAGAADDIVEATVQNDNSAVAFSSFTTQKGVALSAQTKIKAIMIVNEGAAATTVTSSVTGLPVGTLGGADVNHLPVRRGEQRHRRRLGMHVVIDHHEQRDERSVHPRLHAARVNSSPGHWLDQPRGSLPRGFFRARK